MVVGEVGMWKWGWWGGGVAVGGGERGQGARGGAGCFFKQKTAYEMESRDWSSDVCSS
eukprot:COSAG06_NODE_65855_length_256_cov_0.503185_1_plen_57_part_10